MKAKFYLLPVITLALASAWLIKQRQSISAVEETSTQFEKQIAAAARLPSPGADLTRTAPASLAVKEGTAEATAQSDKQPLDWKKIAAQCEAFQQNYDQREMIRLEQRFELMSPAELVAALEKVATLSLSAGANRLLMASLVDELVAKDPELALTHQMEFLGDDTSGMGWQLAKVTQDWARKNPTRAAAWFAEQMAAGKLDSKSLDGKSDLREKIEGALFSVFLDSDSDNAARFLGSMTEDQRAGVFDKYASAEIKEENQLDFVKLVRSQLAGQDQAKMLGQQAVRLVKYGGYASVDSFLERIAATPAERVVCAENVAITKIQAISLKQKITRADLDLVREWTTAQTPDSTNSITGKAIADSLWHGMHITFAEASELVIQYDIASGTQETLSGFLDSFFVERHKDAARALAAKITDPTRREEILKKLQ